MRAASEKGPFEHILYGEAGAWLQCALAHLQREDACRDTGDDRSCRTARGPRTTGTRTACAGRRLWDGYLLERTAHPMARDRRVWSRRERRHAGAGAPCPERPATCACGARAEWPRGDS